MNEWKKKMHNDYNEWMIKYEVICIEKGDKEWVREWERWFLFFAFGVWSNLYPFVLKYRLIPGTISIIKAFWCTRENE